MGLAKVNILGVELVEPLDEAGFRHTATSVGERLGARRIAASVYEAEAGIPIWPYHYHHGIEEWLYVIDGAPLLRDPAGERTLAPGDLTCFPSGPAGAHTLAGPGRFVIFATGEHEEPWMSVYPDSGKVSGPEGILLKSSAVGYWHGEGTAEAAESADVRIPEPSPPGPSMLDASIVELEPGRASEPYHCTYGREEWLLVLAGTAALRHPGGEDALERGDLVCFAEGPSGAHRLSNPGGVAVRALLLATTDLPANAFYPDTGQWLLRNGPGDEVELRGGA